MNQPTKFQDTEKIFVIKLIRCYLTEAVEEKQYHKLSVDKWNADYCNENDEFKKRQ